MATQEKKKQIIGLTGGIGCGKTVAETALKNAGYSVIDADALSRKLFGTGTAGEKTLVSLFPGAAKNGTLDRAALRELISHDETMRRALDAATHPSIIAAIERELETLPAPIILSAPLLFETALSSMCTATVCIYCPREIRLARIMLRDNISERAAGAIIDAQIPDALRCSLADRIVPNTTDISEFENSIINTVKDLCCANT